MMNNLTDKQEKFVQELITGKSQREAYRIAYPKCKMGDSGVDVIACRLFAVPKVRARYNEIHERLVKESEDECIVSAKEVLRELKKIGFANITDFVTIVGNSVKVKQTQEIPKDKIGAIAGIKEGANGIEVKVNDKVKALELLGRHLGLFTDKTELSGDVELNVIVDYGDGDETG